MKPVPDPSPQLSLAGAVCARCGCLCDDLGLELDGDQLLRSDRACDLGAAWLRQPRSLTPTAFAFGQSIDLDAALDEAARRIAASRSPAIVAFPGLTIEALRETVRLSRRMQAPLIPAPPLSLAAERAGIDAPEFTASLGSVRATADLTIFWRADPQRTHPRHCERYSAAPPLLSGKPRRVFLVDDEAKLDENLTVPLAAESIALPCVDPGYAADVELALRTHLRLAQATTGEPTDGDSPDKKLADVLLQADHTHIFLGDDAGQDIGLSAALHRLAAALRNRLHITVSTLGLPGNERGVLETLTWLTGSPGPFLSTKNDVSTSVDWLPGVLDDKRMSDPRFCDLLLRLGDFIPVAEPPFGVPGDVPRITLGSEPDPGAAVSFVVPLLDPRLSGTIMRSDGIMLTLCGDPTQGLPDPTVELLCDLRQRIGRMVEVAR